MQTVSLDQSFSQVVTSLARDQGIAGFYRGLNARIAHMSPVSLLMIVSYEIVKHYSTT